MNLVQQSTFCLTLLMSGISLLTAREDVCKDQLREVLLVDSDFTPDTQFMGQEIGYAPFELLDENSTDKKPRVIGFDAQVAAQVAHRLGFKMIIFQQAPFWEILNNIRAVANVNNIGVSALSITTDREKLENLAFVKYSEDSLAIILPTNDVIKEPLLQDPKTVLNRLNELAEGNDMFEAVLTLEGSRQHGIIGGINRPPYINLVSMPERTLQVALNTLKPGTDRCSLFTDTATANDLKSKGLIDDFTIISPVTFDITPHTEGQVSQGLGIAITAQCCQLYTDIAQAIKDMVADGTLARLREQFNIGNSFAPLDLIPQACAGTQPDIDSNPL